MARKMFRAAADSYQEELAAATELRAQTLRALAVSLREASRESEARSVENVAKDQDKKAAELKDKQQYLPGSGPGFFSRLLAALGIGGHSPKVPAETKRPESPVVVAEQVAANVEMPANLTPREQAAFLARHGRHAEAAEIYESLARQGQRKQSILWNKIGIAYHQMLDFSAASRCYREATTIDPLYAEARNNLGTVHYAQKQYSRAISEYKKALAVSPYSASVHSNLGTAHFARKEYELASVHYAKAIELDPQIFERQGGQGTILQQRSVEDRASFHFYLSKVYARNGDVDRSLLYMRKALEEGFKDRKKFVDDEDFANLQAIPEFQTLLATEFRVL
ncbi:MAG: tetratricopeptide repeat protein [Bryobacterales bacterium]|nr:tetratricopeptide repeat protein [Bryobacterales bacterium]